MKTGYIWIYENKHKHADFVPTRAYYVGTWHNLNFWVNKPTSSNCYHITIMECGLSCCKLTNSTNYKQALEAALKYIPANIDDITRSYNQFAEKNPDHIGKLKLHYKTASPNRIKRMMRASFLYTDEPLINPT